MITTSKYNFVGRYEYKITIPHELWVINHNFGHNNVSVLPYSSTDGRLLHPVNMEYTREQVRISFNKPTSGSLVIIDNIEQNLWNTICVMEAKRS